MRTILIAILALGLVSLSALADDGHQSYISYDDGQSVVRQSDGREVEARVNLPVFPGDELQTGRRGRSEVRLSDGNVLALDRNSAIRFQTILDSYEGEDQQTTTELLYGTAMLHAVRGDSWIRVDTGSATYVSRARSLYSIETSPNSGDEVAVFSGSIEIRTPDGTERVRAGERIRVDRQGVHGQTLSSAYGDSDFERWYIRRAERYSRNSRYLDDRVSYADSDLDGYGSWLWVSDYDNWVWRPRVSVGWRPYYHGYWGHSRWGSLIWISYEPWGWVPYHYGRWSFAPAYGWVWLPGAAYSHAWVYWAWGPSYVGWIPAGWYDCYRPYYSWAYSPYSGHNPGFGFYGRVQFSNIDYRAWTFVDPNTLVSNRVDRAALTTDVIRERLRRDGDRATVSNGFPRLSREQLKDPSSAVGVIARRGAGSGTGKDGSGSLTDLTPFFRRDPELPSSIRSRIARPVDSGGSRVDAGSGSSTVASRLSRDGNAPDARGTSRDGISGTVRRSAPSTGTPSDSSQVEPRSRSGDSGRIEGRRPSPESSPGRGVEREVENDSESRSPGRIAPRQPETRTPPSSDGAWRERAIRRAPSSDSRDPATDSPRSESSVPPSTEWRERRGSGGQVTRPRDSDVGDIPRRVIDQIGGARLEPSDRSSPPREPRQSTGGSRSGGSIPRVRPNSGGNSESSAPRVSRPDSGRFTVSRPSSPPAQKAPSSPPRSSEGGSRSNIKPNKD